MSLVYPTLFLMNQRMYTILFLMYHFDFLAINVSEPSINVSNLGVSINTEKPKKLNRTEKFQFFGVSVWCWFSFLETSVLR